jgi:hypothetical protein
MIRAQARFLQHLRYEKYEHAGETMIPLTPAHMRALLLLCQLGMALLAVFYLRRRQLALFEYIKWGFFAFLIPFFGPFLTVYLHPGRVRDPR